ncbi:hypothetical protein [Ralstonia holmesii]|uniref:Uncharacterized protein n=1 Tax=Ralstonia holmesii TaxID=3058602 RepID=A0ABC8QKU4_9RALS|nr:hypothetical protein [Ralstonia sp. LMG 32967]CAJ0797227.1 hypothetical protein LMG18096_03374 [Ralstonia sp. LMG 32967]CAJ0806195.1 hypothetical protein LMG18093_00144 [Ralstonia sp. LMG 32967]
MATKPKQAKPAKRDPAALHFEGVMFKDAEGRGAVIASSPVIRGAVTGRKYAEPMFGADLDLTSYARESRKQADAVKADILLTRVAGGERSPRIVELVREALDGAKPEQVAAAIGPIPRGGNA